jgi:phospholipid transport system transporter-binding protein
VIDYDGARATRAGSFAATDDGHWVYEGALTMEDAARVLDEADALPPPTDGTVDFRGLLQADSAALAIMLALKRRATAEGRTLTLVSVPAPLKSLAIVYGVDKLIEP